MLPKTGAKGFYKCHLKGLFIKRLFIKKYNALEIVLLNFQGIKGLSEKKFQSDAPPIM